MRIFVVASDIWEGDAVGNHCLSFVRNARRLGFESQAFAQSFARENNQVRPIEDLFAEMTAEDTLLVGYSIYDPLLEKLLSLPGRKIGYFYGVTSPELLREFEPITADKCARSMEQYPLLAQFDLLLASTETIAQFLAPYLDIRQVKILPPISPDMPIFSQRPFAKKPPHQDLKLLVLGRVVPHKRVEDALDVLAKIRAEGCDASLTLVGPTFNEVYLTYLKKRVEDLGLQAKVKFTGKIDEQTLLNYLNDSDALLSFSRHEGFCVPVLEAMFLGLPVFVRDGTAAGEVGAGAAVIFKDTAEAVYEILKMHASEELRQSMIEAGKRRAQSVLAMASDAVLSRIFRGES